ncbi:MAG: universal stress protein [Gemmatimonadaceae bacterium]
MANATAKPGRSTAIENSTTTRLGPILVATDGTTSAAAALRATALLADSNDASVVVVAILEPLPLVAADYGLLLPPVEADSARRQALTERVREQIAQVVGQRAEWRIITRDGDPAATIARLAREIEARMIVVGIGHHDVLTRIFGGEVALHTLRLARCPVLSVSPDFKLLPKRIAIAVDFTEESVFAAREALALLDAPSIIYLVNVAPRLDMQPEAYAMWMSNYDDGVGTAFENFSARLDLPAGAKVETITLNGKPSRALVDFARSAHIDAIVTGSRGAGLLDRMLVGSTATGLIRGAHCSVLAVPEPLGIRQRSGSEPSLPEHEWAALLEGFTRRNAGRMASLEVDDPEIGAQAQQHDYPFLGAAYDRHDKRIELMLGDMEGSRLHLTRGIGDVRRVDILKDAEGRERFLRIAHGAGQTIMTLVR